jgi:hypothetical protein
MSEALKLLILDRVQDQMTQNPSSLAVDLLQCCRDLGTPKNVYEAGLELISEGRLRDCSRGVTLLVALP